MRSMRPLPGTSTPMAIRYPRIGSHNGRFPADPCRAERRGERLEALVEPAHRFCALGSGKVNDEVSAEDGQIVGRQRSPSLGGAPLVVALTGASSGVGRAAARAFAARGAAVG